MKDFAGNSSVAIDTTCNNLVAQDVRKYGTAASIAVVHEGYISIVPVYNPDQRSKYIPCIPMGTRPSRVTTSVMQVLWGTLRNKKVFVVASTIGVQVFDEDGRDCHYEYSCLDSGEKISHFARGLSIVQEEYLCVGNSNGSIFVLETPEVPGELNLTERKLAHKKAITDLTTDNSSESLLVSADESGSVVLWKVNCEGLLRLLDIEDYGFPCTSVKLWNNLIIAGYGSGHIRTFDTNTGRCRTEVAAHARWITAIDVATERGYVLSVGEDSFAKVWKIPSTEDFNHISTTCVKDSLLVGGRFLNMWGSTFCVSIFDSREVPCYSV
uniref:WD repeat-containing protein 54 beta-propeller domain-containing protein n=1 Tax=Timema douglasi TaxID=61478 RepID=A0A7R8Z3G5_TIMDO|nr:unnamed protein product [Timema douglasi]